MKQKLTGFTLIELIVVIVIIGVLSTITTATFANYFQKARDAARQSTIQAAVKIINIAQSDGRVSTYNGAATDMSPFIAGNQTGATGVTAILGEIGDILVPADDVGTYYYYHNVAGDEYAIYNCSEQADVLLIDGTAIAIDTLTDATTDPSCSNGVVTVGTDAGGHLDITGS